MDWAVKSQDFAKIFRDAKAQAAKAYLEGRPVEQALTGDIFRQLTSKLPPIDRDDASNAAGQAISPQDARNGLKILDDSKAQAIAVQQGRDPADPIEVYEQTIIIVAQALFGREPSTDEKAALMKLYRDKVRGQGAPAHKSKAELAMDAEAARRVLANPKLNTQVSSQVTAKAGQYAQALGGLMFVDGNGNAVIVGRRNPNAPLTQAELSNISDMPRVQLPGGLTDLNKKVPAPVSEISHDAPQMGQPGFEYGWATGAWKYWDDMQKGNDAMVDHGQRGPGMATAVYMGAGTMKFFYHISGFGAVEQSSDQLRWDHNRDSTWGRQSWDLAKVGGNTLLSAMTFIPGVELLRGATVTGKALPYAKAIATGDALGIVAADAHAAEAARVVEQGLTTVVKESTAQGGTILATKQAKALTTGLQEYAGKYGITMEVSDGSSLAKNLRAGKLRAAWQDVKSLGAAESVSADRITVNTAIGQAHEPVHALQMIQVRATLLEGYARRAGVSSFALLSEAQKAEAMTSIAPQVARMEQVTSLYEAGANTASGFGGGTLRAGYESSLLSNVSTFRQGLATGVMPAMGEFTLRSRVYGELPMLLGTSQLQIGKTITAGILASRDGITDAQNADYPMIKKTAEYYFPALSGDSDNYRAQTIRPPIPRKKPVPTPQQSQPPQQPPTAGDAGQ